MTTYNHAFDIAFEIPGSTCPEANDVTQEMIIAALCRRVATLIEEGSALEAVGAPFDTYEEPDSSAQNKETDQ